jgi:hypothetical protein
VEVSRVRLAPNTAVAHSAATASTMPSSAVPTGTGWRPRPRSSAYRIPISALGGAPAQAAARTSATGNGIGRRGGSPRKSRHGAPPSARADSATTVATCPARRHQRDQWVIDHRARRAGGQRASPTGVSGKAQRPPPLASPAAPTPMMAPRAKAERHELPHPQAHRRQGQAIILISDELPGGGLPDDGQPGERGQAGQHPPAHRLRPDRALHRGSVNIQVIGAERIQRAELAFEGRQVSLAVPEPHIVERHHQCTVIHGRRRR